MMPSKIGLLLYSSIVFILSCGESKKNSSFNEEGFEPIKLSQAKSFSLFKKGSTYLIKTHLPDKQNEIIQEFVVDTGISNSHRQALFLRSKPKNAIVVSTTYLGYLESLNELKSIKGVANADLIYSPIIKELVHSELIQDIGNDHALNYEKLIEINPDIIFIYDFGPSTSSVIKKLEELRQTVVRIDEFREVSPLGKTEWIKFFGVLYGKFELADSIYRNIESKYNSLLEINNSFTNKPTVFTGLPWKGEWFQPGGKSFQARFFKDAGAKYLWESDEHVMSISVDKEVVFERGLEADYWLNPSNVLNLDEMASEDIRYTNFASYKNQHVFNNNKRMNDYMGNDYWESGIMQPDVILNDLMAIFHPEVFPQYELVYFRKIQEN